MKIFITGILGFVGTYLSRQLIKEGHDVWGIDRASAPPKVSSVDLCNKDVLLDVMQKVNPDYVYHLAALSQVGIKGDTSLLYRINIDGTRNILEVCALQEKKPRCIFISSSQVYGNVREEDLPTTEMTPIDPVNHYGASKAAGEMLVKAFGKEEGLEYVIFRPFNHTGPGQSEYFVVPKIVAAFKSGKDSIRLGNVNTERDFTDVRDVVRAYTCVTKNFPAGETFNIASGKTVKIQEIITILEVLTKRKIIIEHEDGLFRKTEIMSMYGSFEKIKNYLGWEPKIEFSKTLEDMLHYS